ncbi:Mov34/MPN/PAD-1 family protein [Paucibacter sp. O1-1]|nr:Mov34/MPN/PAD-1 family protein [Paucibacter sp. O1-1]MDA3829856.1 Mov34/MPN/PAD-1 family protein [Paucibacter sp. O1-1]
MVTLSRRARVVANPVMGHLTGVDQRVRLCADVLSHVRGYRQLSLRATEAGGQLFGTISAEVIDVTKATGPYNGDERSRYRYRSTPAAAQRSIQEQSQAGMLYLGEWHTHAEDFPGASGLDDDAMQLLLARSQLNSNALMMLIVGRVETIAGLALFTVAPGRVYRWNLGL